MDIEAERIDLLRNSVEQRTRSIMHYQINIDNYRLAIAEITANYSGNSDMASFAEDLQRRLKDEIREQTKERILLKVITAQLQGVGS